MLLAIDIGNTHTVLGVFADATLTGHWRLASETHRTPDEIGVFLRGLFDVKGIDVADFDGIVISSVVPALTPIFAAVSRGYIHREPLVIGPGIRTGMPPR